MTKFKVGLILIIGVLVLQGCATSYGRQNDRVRVYFKSNAAQATVNCHGEAIELPGNLMLKRSSNHDCTAQAPGYELLKFRVWSKLSAEGFRYSSKVNWQRWSKWTLGIGNLFAWPIDFVSGAMKNLENDHYDLRLRAVEKVSAGERVFDETVNVAKKVISLPADAVEEVSGAVMNSTVQVPAEALGLASEQQRKETEQLLQGQAAMERFENS